MWKNIIFLRRKTVEGECDFYQHYNLGITNAAGAAFLPYLVT
jgi:hypothetical protein